MKLKGKDYSINLGWPTSELFFQTMVWGQKYILPYHLTLSQVFYSHVCNV